MSRKLLTGVSQGSVNMAIPQILTTDDVASLLRISRQQVRKLAKNGELPAMRVGTEYRFVRSAMFEKYPSLVCLLREHH